MATVQDVITLALKDAGILGVGQTALYEDMNDAFTRLNQMVALWARQRFFVWHLNTYSVVSTGAQSYTVGPSGAIVTPYVPNQIDSAYARNLSTIAPNQVDYPLQILQSVEDYNQIALKQLQSFPRYLYYDYSYEAGFGTIYPWPLPQAALYQIFITCKEQLGQLASLTTTLNLPPEYNALITTQLAKRLRTAYQMGSDPSLDELAEEAMIVCKGANLQIPIMNMPIDLVRDGIYDPYSDQVY